ncbi:type II toxin-antitoxin system RelE/ParE family toxin [Atlantibacter hermannii]|uniref:type II toxin-antitoxin system RelE/ParE family toxin n=1 Tax=Atlantibacter hermannii TaxID=565 RepID=UPI000EE70BAE|nr:type II toxin-antitoxin system RelE/ParE family toxin [Atlantibacter hermannii]HAP80050.1 addiction module toxin RelE [Enterobacteriaceae bacterium]
MTWTVVLTPEFEQWFDKQEAGLQDRINMMITLLEISGPNPGRPHVDTLVGSRYPNMKELRIQYAGEPWRVGFAFNHRQQAVLLYGGQKTGKKRFYTLLIAQVDAIFARDLARKKENL